MKVRIPISALGLCAGLALAAVPRTATAFEPARTEEGVQRKAVVIAHDVRLYSDSRGEDGIEAPFMEVYFLLEGASGGRVPVTLEPGKQTPDGWLEDPQPAPGVRRTYAEWNTRQMINFETQSGRELARIFADADCAQRFGLTGAAGGCEELGSEPRRLGTAPDTYALLIPVFDYQEGSYRGGFVRVSAGERVVRPQPDLEIERQTSNNGGRLGYDLILVVDATASMGQWFQPTTRALRTFIRNLKDQLGGEAQSPFNVGLLLYRDRKAVADCDIGYLTRWQVDLTGDVESVAAALERAKEASCGSDETAEAVYDALNRAVQDPRWHDGHFKVVLLVGDAPPHSSLNELKNPHGFSVQNITGMSEERNLRFLTFKISPEETQEFRDLAEVASEGVRGRFRALEPDPQVYEQALLTALGEEWQLLTKANRLLQAGIGGKQLAADPAVADAAGIHLDAYELPIIVANLPPAGSGKTPPEFVDGWVPRRIHRKLAVGEYVFMGRREVRMFANVIETIALRAQDGLTDGSEAFISSLRSSLAQMLNEPPDLLFRPGEDMADMMRKARILPFKTTVLSFTPEEVNTWKPADYERLIRILAEKTAVLRDHVQRPSNQHLFGNKPHVYVPRELFP